MSDPFRQGDNIPRNHWRGIMGITEEDNFCDANKHGGRTLGLWDNLWKRG